MVMETRMRIGNLLVQAGIISFKTLERALEMQKGSGKRLGALLKDMGIITEGEVIEALARQCNLRIVRNFAEESFPKELLDLVPAQLALEKLVFPLKRYEGILAVAILDPFDNATIDFLLENTGLRIYPVLATRDDIISAIMKHYPNETLKKNIGQKVLIIDPSPVIMKMYQSALANEGYYVTVAPDGVDGLKVAFTQHPDLILCDRLMTRMDCGNFMHALRAHPETSIIPIILMSSKLSAEDEERALDAGFIDFIGKPATPMYVLGRVKKIFASLENKPHHVEQLNSPPAIIDVPFLMGTRYI
jgi:CheY-like chemotaxis protein